MYLRLIPGATPGISHRRTAGGLSVDWARNPLNIKAQAALTIRKALDSRSWLR